MDDVATHPPRTPGPNPPPGTAGPPPDQVRTVTVADHELRIYVEWPALCADMLADIARATRRVWLEVYIFRHDDSGQRLAAALCARAQAGVDVRVLYDAIGCQFTPGAFFATMAAAGVKLYRFHPLRQALLSWRFFSLLNRRDHRKLLIIDEIAGYFGGMNIIDNNALPTHHAAAAPPPPGAWRDVHLRLAGPQLPELAESFDRSWRRAHGERLERKPRAYHRGHFESHGVSESIRFFDSGPGLRYSRAARVYTHMLRGARRSVTLSMAYFIPVGRVFRALLRARRRGVRLRIIVPGQSDVPLVQYATGYLYHKLVMRGFLIYERKNRMLHSKVMIVDGRWTLVGSANLDPRSLWTNLEFLAAIRSERLAAVMLDICRYEMERSRRLRVTDVTRLTPWARFVNMLAWSARWWL